MPENNNKKEVLQEVMALPATNSKITWPKYIALIAVGVLLIWFPFNTNNYLLTFAITLFRTAYLAQCWNLMSGYAGLFSFGHSAFFGLGAYTSTWLFIEFGVSPWLGMFVGAINAGLVGLFLGYLACRYKLRDSYFALTTLAFAEILRVFFNNSRYFNASIGYNIPYRKDWTLFQFNDKKYFYFIAFIMIIGITYLIYRLRKTKMGLYFVAIREDEDASNALGVNILRYKLYAIGLSAMLTALAGTFYSQFYLFIDPSIAFGNLVSINAIAPCVLGGVGTIFGPVVGAIIITLVSELTNAYFGSFAGLNMVIYGLIVIAVIVFLPQGVFNVIKDAFTSQKVRNAAVRKERGDE